MVKLRRGLVVALAAMTGALGLVGLTALVELISRHPALSAEAAAAAVLLLVVAVALANRRPGVAAATVLELDLAAVPAELPRRGPLAALSGPVPLTLAATVSALERAARDKRVRGLVLRSRLSGAPQAVVEELRDAVQAFGRSGKFTVAVADTFGDFSPANAAYFLATACQEVALHPTGTLGMVPLWREANFYGGLLERLGVRLEVQAREEYKSALGQVTGRRFSTPDREQSQRVLESLWAQQVDQVAQARRLAPEAVRTLADGAPLSAEAALAGGLVDRLAYSDDVVAAAKHRAGPKAKLLYLPVYQKRAGKGRQPGPPVVVGVVRAVGEIHRSATTPYGLRGGPVVVPDKLVPQIRAAARHKKTKAVVLRVDSPGGSVVASDSIWRELVKLKETGKPLIVSMGAVAASGGYYIAAPADRVISQPGTITGSIGVISAHPVLSAAKAKLDVGVDEVHTGAEPSMFSVNRPYSPAQRERAGTLVDQIYQAFTQRVADGRKMPLEGVLQVAKGRVWTGADALGLGLVDELGGLARAVAVAVELSGAPAGSRPVVRDFPRKPRLFSLILRKQDSSDDVAAASAGLWPVVARVPMGGDLAWTAARRLGEKALLHLGFDPRSYWLP